MEKKLPFVSALIIGLSLLTEAFADSQPRVTLLFYP